jgi:phytoene dehydrogenase-like protein
MNEVVIIGGGQNGLTAAFYLAKAGLRPIVLESRPVVGGGAITGELHPGFKCPTLSHHTSLWTDIVSDMELVRLGVTFLEPHVDILAAPLEGPPLLIYGDPDRTADAMRARSPKDAEAYPTYRTSMEQIATVVGALLASPPPDVDTPGAGDLWSLLSVGRKFRRLGRRDGYRLLRWGPMAVADLTREWFESDLLCAAIAGPAVSGTMLGPRSAGSGLVLLLQEAHRMFSGNLSRVRGGPGALTLAMAIAARDAGADVRRDTTVQRILVKDGRAAGVIANGREIPAAAVVSAVDPKTTFLRLMDPTDLTPDFLTKIGHYRATGTLARVNLALAGLPRFRCVENDETALLSGRIHIGPTLDYIERAFDHAKYGEMSVDPWLEVTIPSILDPDLAPKDAHVMSVYASYAPFQLRGGNDWVSSRDLLLQRVLATLERFAPGLGSLVLAAEVVTPADMASTYGLWGGHIHHGELALDQLATMRPLLGYGRYESPVRGLYLCGAGTHPGGFMTGGSGKIAAREIVRSMASSGNRG